VKLGKSSTVSVKEDIWSKKSMRKLTWGAIPKERTSIFLKRWLLHVGTENYADTTIKWETVSPESTILVVESSRNSLLRIAYPKATKNHYFTEIIQRLKELEILEDKRTNTQGSKLWSFNIRFWSKDIDENLKQFDRKWEERRPKNKSQENTNPIPVRLISVQTETEQIEMERDEESFCVKTILRPGSLLRIKGPKYTGKTFFLNRLLAKLYNDEALTYDIVVLDWQSEFDSTIHDQEQFLKSFCATVSHKLGLPDDLDKYWERRGTPTGNTTSYFDQYLLPKVQNQLILVLEGMDRIFHYPHPLPVDFCGLIRGWHEKSGRDESWHKLSIVAVYATDDYAMLGMDISPFANVGEAITLNDFTLVQVKNLAQRYGLNFTEEQVVELTNKSNGHPFLVDQALKIIKERLIEFEKILKESATQEGIYSDHLLGIWNVLRSKPHLSEAFKKLVTESEPVPLPPDILFKLQSLGLIELHGNYASPRCQIYREYFAANL
jgi:AAA-like domain/Effector-associated domain 4